VPVKKEKVKTPPSAGYLAYQKEKEQKVKADERRELVSEIVKEMRPTEASSSSSHRRKRSPTPESPGEPENVQPAVIEKKRRDDKKDSLCVDDIEAVNQLLYLPGQEINIPVNPYTKPQFAAELGKLSVDRLSKVAQSRGLKRRGAKGFVGKTESVAYLTKMVWDRVLKK